MGECVAKFAPLLKLLAQTLAIMFQPPSYRSCDSSVISAYLNVT